jgi:type I restriction enzyme S subunit
MEVKTGHKETEVGIIPRDWDVKKLGELVSLRTGPFGSSVHKSDYINGGIPFINPIHIFNGELFPDPDITLSPETVARLSEFQLRTNDIILGRRGEMGRCAVVQDDQQGWLCGSGSMILRPNSKIVSQFLQRIMSSSYTIAKIEEASVGSTMINLNQAVLFGLSIPYPPLPEQKAIAEALSDADALIEALEQLIVKKRQVKQGAMQELLTGKRRLPGFDSGWEVKTFGELFYISGGLSASRDQLSSDGYCYLHYGDIHLSKKTYIDLRSEFQDIPKLNIPLKKVSSASLLNDGDVVFVDASEDDEGASKHVVVVNPDRIPFISGLHTIVAKSKTNELNHEYRRYCFQTREVKKQFLFYAVGTKVSGISKTNIAKINLPVPSLPEQTAIAEILSDMDAEIAALEAKLAKARQIKQGMMQELLTGRIRLVESGKGIVDSEKLRVESEKRRSGK